MKHDRRKDAFHVRFTEPSQELSRRMSALFEQERRKHVAQKRPHKGLRSFAYATACAALLTVAIGAGWFGLQPLLPEEDKESRAVVEESMVVTYVYVAPKALVFMNDERPRGAFDFSDALGGDTQAHSMTRRKVLHWPVQ